MSKSDVWHCIMCVCLCVVVVVLISGPPAQIYCVRKRLRDVPVLKEKTSEEKQI